MEKADLDQVLQKAEALCRQRGARLTAQRRTVLEILCASDKPMSAYEILDRLRETLANPAPPTVYRALDFLLQQGLAHKLESLHAYIGCSHPDHPHASQFLICADCGDVNEVESDDIARSLSSAASESGFQTHRPVVELLGTCADCADKDEN